MHVSVMMFRNALSTHLLPAVDISSRQERRISRHNENEKKRMVAEAKCLIATRYFDMFRHYGGLPLLYASFTGTESGYEIPRATVEETVNYMIKMLDDAINSGGLVWAYADADLASKAGHWTKAGAMALKCKIWQFAASPLFNDVNGYAGGTSEAEQQHLVCTAATMRYFGITV
mgnify:CR=1 FL=1